MSYRISTFADVEYQGIIEEIQYGGDSINTRNFLTKSLFGLPNVTFDNFPIVTLRKTPIMKAIREMEWFMSGEDKCPEELLDWWSGQLHSSGNYYCGYPSQFRHAGINGTFDQVKFILNGLKNNPNSRRLLLTVWNPEEMATITDSNDNPNTPTCCHSIIIQFFVRNGVLHTKHYQRSADMLLGVPANWAQSWALLLYFAHHSDLTPGTMTWMWGDAHIYQEESHLQVVEEILNTRIHHPAGLTEWNTSISLEYSPKETNEEVPPFLASDFKIIGEIPEPVTKIRPKLL